jgi:hypothetical protein
MDVKRIICLYGGPGISKSTTCAGLYYKLKLSGYECEMNREYIKDWVWEDRLPRDGDQSYFFSKMSRRERIYMGKGMDFIITDSPLILTHFYGLRYDKFEQLFNTSLSMLKNHHSICKENGYKVDHFLLKRVKPYSEAGRLQTEAEAKLIDFEIEEMLKSLGIKYTEVDGDEGAVDSIINLMSSN